MTQATTTPAQNNWYMVLDSMGREMDIYIIASNLKDAYKESKKDTRVPYYHKLKRCYNGGVRG